MKKILSVLVLTLTIAWAVPNAYALPGCDPSDLPGCGGCACEVCVCEMDPYCCTNSWDGLCVGECLDPCGGCEKPENCGDGECVVAEGENCANCVEDCGCDADAICYEFGCCPLACDGKSCGEDGCGGTCGECAEGEYCTEDFACDPIPPCEIHAALHCGDVLELDTAEGINAFGEYSCVGWGENGPELGFSFDTEVEDLVVITLEETGDADHDLFLLEGSCLPDNCIEYSGSDIDFVALPGGHYFLVVDGYGDDVGTLTLSVWCQSTCEAECSEDNQCQDDGCMGECPCADPDAVCFGGECCVADCEGLVCGSDGCGGSCGDCAGACLDNLVCMDGPGCISQSEPMCDGCACQGCVCEMDPFCCETAWDSICVSECVDDCGGCLTLDNCGDGSCVLEDQETCFTCPEDCGCGEDKSCFQNACCATECNADNGCQDDSCGGICPCESEEAVCWAGACCEAACEAGMGCQSDGCGGTCPCDGEEEVCFGGECCVPSCEDKVCGDDGCGGNCGNCDGQCLDGFACLDGPGCIATGVPGCPDCPCEACVCAFDAYCCQNAWDSLCAAECHEDCDGCYTPENCGDGECLADEYESCQNCPEDCGCADGESCYQKECCHPTCDDAALCQDDGCGGICPCLGDGEVCFQGECCSAVCDGLECGDDSCGGSCGICDDGFGCKDGACLPVSGPSECKGTGEPSGDDCEDLTYEGCCDELGRVLWCDLGKVYCIDCAALSPSCGWQGSLYDCGTDGSADPSGLFPIECSSCDPPCGDGEQCVGGECVVCEPQCEGKNCGADGCGGECGECPENLSCQEGLCQVVGCDALEGPGCGGCPCEICVCAMDPFCCENTWDAACANQCVESCEGCPEPDPFCGDLVCDGDEDCTSCAKDCVCEDGLVCSAGECVDCAPSCDGLDCGDDGCGGSCGDCAEEEECVEGLCKGPCDPDCTDKVCGDDGCDGSCGECDEGEVCLDGTCGKAGLCGNGTIDDGEECENDDDCGATAVCTECVCIIACASDCVGKECGDDGCGDSCGDCPDGSSCEEFLCVPPVEADVVGGDVIVVADAAGAEDLQLVDGAGKGDVAGEEPKGSGGGCSATTAGNTSPLLLLIMATLMLLAWRRRIGA